MAETQASMPTPAAVLAALAKFQRGMPEPGQVAMSLVAAQFRVSWIAAAQMIAQARQSAEKE